MKKKLILLLLCAIFLSSCGEDEKAPITREEYESIVAKIDQIESQIEINESFDTPSDKDKNITEESGQIESNDNSEDEKVWLKDFTFEYDENNKIFISLYQDGKRMWYFSGGGVYENGNLSLLQYERKMGFFWLIDLLGKEGHNIDLSFTVGDNEYSFVYIDGELKMDTIPLDSWDYSSFLTSEHTDKLNAFQEFDDFIHND